MQQPDEIPLENIKIDYQRLRQIRYLNRGGQGAVFAAELDSTVVAVKEFYDDKFNPETIAMMTRARHENIAELLYYCDEPYCLVLPMCQCSLYDIVHGFIITQNDFKKYCLQIAVGMQFLHQNNIVHRDLKSQNILLTAEHSVKITDFDLSKKIDFSLMDMATKCGTPLWMAPEIILDNSYTKAVDKWSYGVVLWEMIAQRLPYDSIAVAMNGFQLADKLRKSEIHLPWPKACRYTEKVLFYEKEYRDGQKHRDGPPVDPSNIHYRRIFMTCLAVTPEERPNFSEVVYLLQKYATSLYQREYWHQFKQTMMMDGVFDYKYSARKADLFSANRQRWRAFQSTQMTQIEHFSLFSYPRLYGDAPTLEMNDESGEGDPVEGLVGPREPKKLPDGRWRCPLCGNSYKNRKTCMVHRWNVHKVLERVTVKCPVKGCEESSTTIQALCMHMKDIHEFSTDYVEMIFEGEEKYKMWYNELTATNNVAFVAHRVQKADKVIMLYCNRSGDRSYENRKSEASSSVKNKWQKGSSKIGAVCPAFISRVKKGSQITMRAQLAHYGHTLDVIYTPMPEVVRNEIAELLRERHRIEDIPDILRQTSQRDPLMRGYYANAEEVRRVADSIGINRFNRKAKDHMSVHSLMIEMQMMEDSPVLYYQPATVDKKLCIVLQTVSMRKAMVEFGGDILCCDATHETTRYPGILLGTLMTIGAAGEGQPVAFFIIGAESENELLPAFQALASKLPNFRTRFFMSDGANAFWNAFKKCFDVSGTTRQLCLWHIWRNWIAKLLLISSQDHRRRARAALRVLASSHTAQIFAENYEVIVRGLLQNHAAYAEFTAYFVGQYPETSGHMWATFGRMGSQVSTNMFLESYHRVLKKKFLNRQSNRRLEFLINILVEDVAPYYHHVQLTSVTTGSFTKRQKEASLKHDAGANIICEIAHGNRVLDAIDETTWRLSAVNGIDSYTIRRQGCKRICAITCKGCGICPHEFICDCPDSLQNSWSCKHMHLCAMLYGSRETANESNDDDYMQDADLVTETEADKENNDIDIADEGAEQEDIVPARCLRGIASAALKRIELSAAMLKQSSDTPLPASFNALQESNFLVLMKKADSALAALSLAAQKAVDPDGYGCNRQNRTMNVQPRSKPKPRSLEIAGDSSLVPYRQREKRKRPDLDEERQQLIKASKELQQEVLQVDSNIRCSVCKQGIKRAIDRHVCPVGDGIVHKGICLDEHLEDCVQYQVSFSKKKR